MTDESIEKYFGDMDDQYGHDKKKTKDLWLIPGYLLPVIPKGTKLTSILGDESEFDPETHKDHELRFGLTAYGLHSNQFKS